MTPLESWCLLGFVASLGVLAALAIADWIDSAEDRRWERDAERWQRARDALQPPDNAAELPHRGE